MPEKAPRVLHVVPALFGASGVVGGGERYTFELARHMAKQVPTTLLAFGAEGKEERAGDLRVVVARTQWRPRGQAQNPVALDLVREVLGADVVHCHQQHIVASSLAAAVARAARRRVFVSDLGGGGWDVSAYVSTDRWYHGHLHISAYSRKVALHEQSPRAHVIYGGVDGEKFHPDPVAAAQAHPKRALFVGRLLPHKGVNYVVDAIGAGLSLTLLGRPYFPTFADELRRRAEGKDVVFRSECDDVELVREYQRALCVVLPSVYRTVDGGESRVPELLGQTLLEGMACGIPAICTDVASMPEVVVDGVTGFVVPPNDPAAIRAKLEWLRDHPAEAAKMGEAGRRRAEETFSWSTVVDRCLAIYAGRPPR